MGFRVGEWDAGGEDKSVEGREIGAGEVTGGKVCGARGLDALRLIVPHDDFGAALKEGARCGEA